MSSYLPHWQNQPTPYIHICMYIHNIHEYIFAMKLNNSKNQIKIHNLLRNYALYRCILHESFEKIKSNLKKIDITK